MTTIPQHTVTLQDGSLCNFRKRIWKKATLLFTCFKHIPDPRKRRGIRHDLPFLLFILFAAMTTGCTTLKDCQEWAIHNKKFLRKHFSLLHGIPDPTTFSYILRQLSPEAVGEAYRIFLQTIGITLGDVLSADGKTMRAVAGEDTIKHILSLFSHLTHTSLAQVGVSQKENEIPALRRLIEVTNIAGKLLLADALHTNSDTAKAIILAKADYLLIVKGNQKTLFGEIIFTFTKQQNLPGSSQPKLTQDSHITQQKKRKRNITTTVITTNDTQLCSYLEKTYGFPGIQTIGILKRNGIRTSKDGTITLVDEVICFLSSRKLSAKQITKLLRGHWCIENNLHWVKDFVFLEDRQTLRSGNAPQIMSLLRSMCISICNLVKLKSISDALHTFQKNQIIHYQFLRMAAII